MEFVSFGIEIYQITGSLHFIPVIGVSVLDPERIIVLIFVKIRAWSYFYIDDGVCWIYWSLKVDG